MPYSHTRTKMTRKVFVLLIASGTILLLLFFGQDLGALWSRAHWALFRNSKICTRAESWKGLGESALIKKATARMASRSKMLIMDDAKLQKWETPFGILWFPGKSSRENVHFALAQFENGGYPGLKIHPGDVVLDCGGFVGDWTKWALQEGASKAVIVEPAAEALECIRRNLAEEIRQGSVILCPKAVWDGYGFLYLSHAGDNPAANAIAGEEVPQSERIETTTIDRIVSDLRLDRLDIIKMDIEGAEIRAIRGASKTLNRFRPQLAVATEHTQDYLKNDMDVLQAVRETAPFYRMRCGYCSKTNGVVTPETLYFFK